MPGSLASVDMEDLAGDERGPLEVEIPSTTSSTSPTRPNGCRRPSGSYDAGSCSGVSITPSETAFARTPRDAYSIASERVTETSPPLVRATSPAGRPLSAWSTRLVLMFTRWPLAWATIVGMTRWVMWKNPARLTAVIAS